MLALICGRYHRWDKFLIYCNVRWIHNSIKTCFDTLQKQNQSKRFETFTKYFFIIHKYYKHKVHCSNRQLNNSHIVTFTFTIASESRKPPRFLAGLRSVYVLRDFQLPRLPTGLQSPFLFASSSSGLDKRRPRAQHVPLTYWLPNTTESNEWHHT